MKLVNQESVIIVIIARLNGRNHQGTFSPQMLILEFVSYFILFVYIVDLFLAFGK